MRIKHLVSKTKAFGADTRGTFAVTFGLLMLPLALAAGIAIDTAIATFNQNKIGVALDAASLAVAGAVDLKTPARIKLGEDVFAANLPKHLAEALKAKPEFRIDDKLVRSRALANMPTTLMHLAGIDSVEINLEAEVAVPQQKNAEIALVLDYSGSMNDPINGKIKYKAMRDEALSLITALTKTEQDRKKVKFALVPFSRHVYLDLPSALVNGGGNGATCVLDRKIAGARSFGNDTTTQWISVTSWRDDRGNTRRCSEYADRSLVVRPLTSDFGALKGQLAAMRPMELTHIALGAEMGLHVLSPDSPFTQGVSFKDEKTKKFLVILTDGKQTQEAHDADGSTSVAAGERNLSTICAQAKANKVEVVTIAYDLDDTDTRKNLASCSSGSGRSFVVESTSDLTDAFNGIKKLLMTEIYLNK